MGLENLTEKNIKTIAKQVFKDNKYLGIKVNYDMYHSQFGISILSKKIFNEELYFILNSIRTWFPFDYANKEEFFDELETFNITLLSKVEFLTQLNKIEQIIEEFKYTSSFKLTIGMLFDIETIQKAYLIKNDWNFKCLYLNMEDALITFIWSTSE